MPSGTGTVLEFRFFIKRDKEVCLVAFLYWYCGQRFRLIGGIAGLYKNTVKMIQKVHNNVNKGKVF